MERSRTRVPENQREWSRARVGGGNGEERWIAKIIWERESKLMEMYFNVGSEGQGKGRGDS